MTTFKGEPPGTASGEMSRRTAALRPALALDPKQVAAVRRLRRGGLAPEAIAAETGHPVEEVERALMQMRTPRPESTRGTLNVTLAAQRVVMAERRGGEPMWQTFDRIVDEWLRLRGEAAAAPGARRRARRGTGPGGSGTPSLPGLD